ncbi:hypothetical protein K492DRAFT_110435, partial [Lichtheimia hyalospora FSU 10163]
PTFENLIENINKKDILEHAKESCILVHEKVINLINDFINLKKEYGTNIEKKLYENMTDKQFIIRLIKKRPFYFYNKNDISMLRDGTIPNENDWNKIGTNEENKIKIYDYLSYDEMQISSLIGVSTETYFINNGERYNFGKKMNIETFEEIGIHIGLVGARFEKKDKMESQHIIISKKYNHENLNLKLLSIWAKFYNQKQINEYYYFPSFEEIFNFSDEKKYYKLNDYEFFNIDIYKQRLSIPIEILLKESNNRSILKQKEAYIHVVGLVLGVWQITKKQATWFIEIFIDILKNTELNNFPDVTNVINTELGEEKYNEVKNNKEIYIKNKFNNKFKIKFSKRNPCDKILSDKKLLIASFAWDGNSFVGNEYWNGCLGSSGDPAAACCSSIPQLLNPYINPFLEK